MTDARPDSHEAREADDMGERPDLGRTRDALVEALSGSDMGSDTRAGSLRGGSASGSDDDPDQAAINTALTEEGRAFAAPRSPSGVDPDPIENTGVAPGDGDPDPVEGQRDDEAEAATG